MSEYLSIEVARDLVDDATRYHSTPWKRVMTGDGGFYGVTDRTGSVVAGSPPVSALIAAAPTLITDLLSRLEAAEQQVARVRFLMSDFQANGNSRELSDPTAAVWHEAALQILRALDGDQA